VRSKSWCGATQNESSPSRVTSLGASEELDSELNSTANDVPDSRPNPEELYSQHQLRQQLRQALEQLPRLYSTVFLLRDMQGLSVAETAAALQLSVPTVKTRLLRARLQLREILSKSLIPTWTEADYVRSNLIAPVRPLAVHPVERRSKQRAQLVPQVSMGLATK
jgi:hypothetical protein